MLSVTLIRNLPSVEFPRESFRFAAGGLRLRLTRIAGLFIAGLHPYSRSQRNPNAASDMQHYGGD
jgi:hypothetical protein